MAATSSTVFRSDCLQGRTALITGGAGGIGRVIVSALSAHGASVAVNDILSAEACAGILTCGPRVGYFQADAADESAVTALFDRVEKAFGVPTVVGCHAGVVEPAPYDSLTVEQFTRTLDVNVKAAFLVSREAVRRMRGVVTRTNVGRIIFTSSWVQDVPWPEIAVYAASKSAMKMLMRSLAREVADEHIRVNAVAPGIVGTGMAKQQWDTDERYRARAQRAIPLGFLQPAESVADAFLFLASDASNYMTGATLLVDGGCSLYPMDR